MRLTPEEQAYARALDPKAQALADCASVAVPTAYEAHLSYLAKQEQKIRALMPITVRDYVLAHQQRVVDEQAALDERRALLKTFVCSSAFGTVDAAEQARLIEQQRAMDAYSNVLGARIGAFKPG